MKPASTVSAGFADTPADVRHYMNTSADIRIFCEMIHRWHEPNCMIQAHMLESLRLIAAEVAKLRPDVGPAIDPFIVKFYNTFNEQFAGMLDHFQIQVAGDEPAGEAAHPA